MGRCFASLRAASRASSAISRASRGARGCARSRARRTSCSRASGRAGSSGAGFRTPSSRARTRRWCASRSRRGGAAAPGPSAPRRSSRSRRRAARSPTGACPSAGPSLRAGGSASGSRAPSPRWAASWPGAAPARAGAGQPVDVSMFETTLACLTTFHDLSGQFMPGPLPQSIDTPSIEPARDGWVGLVTYTGQQWKDFCLLIGRPELGEDERYYEARVRMEHLAVIQRAMHAWTRAHDVDEIIARASELRIPAAPIGDGKRVLGFDHFRARGLHVRSPHGDFLQPRVPYRLQRCAPAAFARAPRLGEHTATAALPRTRDARGQTPKFRFSAAPAGGAARGGSHRLLGRAGRDALPRGARRRRREDRVDSAARRHALRGRRAHAAALGARARLPWREPQQARPDAEPRRARGPRAPAAPDRRRRRAGGELLGARDGSFWPALRRARRAQRAARHAAHAGLGAGRPLARPRGLCAQRRAGERPRLAHGLPGSAARGARRLRSLRRHARRPRAAARPRASRADGPRVS